MLFIDDYCYFMGESQELNLDLPYFIIFGDRASGKSTLCKKLSKNFYDIQFVSFQTYGFMVMMFGIIKAPMILQKSLGYYNIGAKFNRNDIKKIKLMIKEYYIKIDTVVKVNKDEVEYIKRDVNSCMKFMNCFKDIKDVRKKVE